MQFYLIFFVMCADRLHTWWLPLRQKFKTQLKMCQRIENMPKAKALKKLKRDVLSRWKRHIVVNSMQARLRAQLGDRSKYSGERRRRSVVVASIVLTITGPLRGSYPLLCNLQAALIRSFGASFACMELTIISRFQRLQASTKSLRHALFYDFSVLSPKACPYDMAMSVLRYWIMNFNYLKRL